MPSNIIVYAYPLLKWVSFSFIAQKHVQQLKQYYAVREVDGRQAYIPILSSPNTVLLHPYFWNIPYVTERALKFVKHHPPIIGFDVADSDHITEDAVKQTQYATAIIVPSNFSKNAYVNSGTKVPVHAIPHGVDQLWLTLPKQKPTIFKPLQDYTCKTGRKVITSWILHSPYRKGEDILYKVYEKLRKERDGIILAIRRERTLNVYDETTSYPTFSISHGMLSDNQIMELFDLCDIYLLASRGGAFEHPALQAMARNVIPVGAEGGAWQDYIPSNLLVPYTCKPKVFENNPIHDGCGVEMDVEKTVSKLHEILNNMGEYKAQIREYNITCVKEKFTWETVGEKLRDIVNEHL
jgi:glycosyltransferase involved in cell wall biosynthesis